MLILLFQNEKSTLVSVMKYVI